MTNWARDFEKVAQIRNNVCEFPYEFDTMNSRTRYMMTTNNPEGADE